MFFLIEAEGEKLSLDNQILLSLTSLARSLLPQFFIKNMWEMNCKKS